MDRISIREASSGDLAVLESLRKSVGWSTVETGLAAMREGRSVAYILEMDGAPAASGALVMQAESHDLADGKQRSLVSNLIVDPRFQGRGLGTTLLLFLEEEARRRGFTRMTIGVDAPNVRARKLYERNGYILAFDRVESWGPVNYLMKDLVEK